MTPLLLCSFYRDLVSLYISLLFFFPSLFHILYLSLRLFALYFLTRSMSPLLLLFALTLLYTFSILLIILHGFFIQLTPSLLFILHSPLHPAYYFFFFSFLFALFLGITQSVCFFDFLTTSFSFCLFQYSPNFLFLTLLFTLHTCYFFLSFLSTLFHFHCLFVVLIS